MENISVGVIAEAPNGANLPCCKVVVEDVTDPFVFDSVTERGGTYTFSGWIRSTSPSKFVMFEEEYATSVNWQFIEKTFIAESDSLELLFDEGTYYLFQIKLEEGSTATRFSLSPEDSDWSYFDENGLPVIDIETEKRVISGYLIAADTITADKLVADSITSREIAAGAVTAQKINVIDLSAINADLGHIRAGTLESPNYEYVDGHFAKSGMFVDLVNAILRTPYFESTKDGAYYKGHLEAKSITVAELADGAVSAVKIANGAVNADKLSANAVTADKIKAGAVTADKIEAKAITSDKIDVTNLSSIKANLGTVTAGKMQSSDYAYSSGSYSSKGMLVDLDNKMIRTPYFSLSNSGANFKGDVDANSLQISGASIRHVTNEGMAVNGYDIYKWTYDGSSQAYGGEYSHVLSDTIEFDSTCVVRLHKQLICDSALYVDDYVSATTMYSGKFTGHSGLIHTLKCYQIYVNGTLTHSSDETLKDIAQEAPSADLLYELKPIQYTWKDSSDKSLHFGLGARHTKEILEKRGIEDQGIVNKMDDDHYGINYNDLHGLEIATIQAQKKKIDELEERIERLEKLLLKGAM